MKRDLEHLKDLDGAHSAFHLDVLRPWRRVPWPPAPHVIRPWRRVPWPPAPAMAACPLATAIVPCFLFCLCLPLLFDDSRGCLFCCRVFLSVLQLQEMFLLLFLLRGQEQQQIHFLLLDTARTVVFAVVCWFVQLYHDSEKCFIPSSR